MSRLPLFHRLLCSFLGAGLVLAAQAHPSEEDDFKLARNLYRDARDYATAAELLAQFLRNYPASAQRAEAQLLLARSYKQSGRCELAVAAYETFYQENPEHLSTAEAWRERAACLAELGQDLEAARAFAELQQRFSASEFASQALLEAGVNYTHAQRLEQAEIMYRRVLSEYPSSQQVHQARYLLARLLFAQGQAETAQKLLGEISASAGARPEAAQALLFDGRIDLFLGRREAAEKKFKALQQRFPQAAQSDTAYLEQADYLYENRLFSQAGDAFQTGHSRLRDPQLKRRALLGLAESRRQSRQTREALAHYQALLAELGVEDPDYLKARLGQAIALGQAGQFAAAVGLFQGLIQVGDAPQAREALRELGALYRARGDHNRAITWYRNYLQQADNAPDSESVRFELARLYASMGYYQEATAMYRQLVDGPLAAQAQLGLAQAFEQSGQKRAALREYVAFLELFPSGDSAEVARQRIEYLREFTVMDPEALNRTLQQAWIDELSGTPRQQVQLEVARALFAHHDFAAAARSFEHHVAAYPGTAQTQEAQYLLAESLLRLARQRHLEGQLSQADSLRALALQEYRILTQDWQSPWAEQAQIRLIETQAAVGPDSLRWRALEQGFAAFVQERGSSRSPHLDQARLHLAEARLSLGQEDPAKLAEALATYEQLRRLSPQGPLAAQALFGVALCRARQGQYGAAADSLQRLLQSYPDNPQLAEVLFELSQVLLQHGRPREAIARLQELHWGYPAFARRREAQQLLADTYFQLGEYGGAVGLYRQLLEGGEDKSGHLRQHLAQAYHHLGEYNAALETYGRLLDDAPAASALDSVYFAQAVLQARLGQEEEAARLFLRVRDQFAHSGLAAEAAARAGHIFFAMGRYGPAYETYRPLLDKSRDPLVSGQAVLALFRLHRLKEAREAAKDFGRRFGNNLDWHWRFQLEEGLYYQARKEYDKALELFRQVEKQGGEGADEGAYGEAVTLWEQNQAAPSQEGAARALEALSRFAQKYPTSPRAADAFLRLGNYHFGLHNFLQAAGAYKRALEVAGTPGGLVEEALWKLVQSYQGAHEYEAAHRAVDRLLRQHPHHPRTLEARLELGIILKEKGQYAQAIAQLEELLAQQNLDGNDASEARFYIGEAYQNMGEYRKAIEAYYKVSYHGAGGFSQWITSADFQRAKCHESLGEYATAISVYQRILQREGSNTPQGEMAREQVELLRRRLGSLN